jgi:hypothetical protein
MKHMKMWIKRMKRSQYRKRFQTKTAWTAWRCELKEWSDLSTGKGFRQCFGKSEQKTR